jgi:hypothetical protein
MSNFPLAFRPVLIPMQYVPRPFEYLPRTDPGSGPVQPLSGTTFVPAPTSARYEIPVPRFVSGYSSYPSNRDSLWGAGCNGPLGIGQVMSNPPGLSVFARLDPADPPMPPEIQLPFRIPTPVDEFLLDSSDATLYYVSEPFVYEKLEPDAVYRIWPGRARERTWSLDELLVFLNEFGNNWRVPDTLRSRPATDKRGHYYATTFASLEIRHSTIRVRLSEKWSHIEVWAFGSWLMRPGWQYRIFAPDALDPTFADDFQRVRRRQAVAEKDDLKYTSKAIMQGIPIAHAENNDVSSAVRYLIQALLATTNPAVRTGQRLPTDQALPTGQRLPTDVLMPANCDIYKRAYLAQLFQNLRPAPSACTLNYEAFQKYGGYLVLDLQQRRRGDDKPAFMDPTTQTMGSITGGCYVHPWAASILRNPENHIDGLIMDTTWTVLRQFVTAIIVAVSHNTAIPLAFAFGPIECSELYEHFWTVFNEKFHINLADFIFESDQGSGLRKFCKEHGIRQRLCLRHYLASLKDRMFAVYVNYLVKATTVEEFQLLRQAFLLPLSEAIKACGPRGLERARAQFAKAGLVIDFVEDTVTLIKIGDDESFQERWKQVSILQKIEDLMPPTTNCLESINGHHNDATPRNNLFWASACRLAEQIQQGILHFSAYVRHNFNRATRQALILRLSLGEDEMARQKAEYEADANSCSCGQTRHYSAMYRIPVPCCHRLASGASRPRMVEPPKLQYSNDPDAFELAVVWHASAAPARDDARKKYLMEMAASNIKRLTHTGHKKSEIVAWVEHEFQNPPPSNAYAQTIPVSVVLIIAKGVTKFGR